MAPARQTRRQFLNRALLSGLAAGCSPALVHAATMPQPALARTPSAAGQRLPSEVDTVVIGAGAAGLAAARRLETYGRSVLVLEADSRIGGRAYTDTTTFDAPVDIGCAWLHQADRNPFTPLAQSRGFDLFPHDDSPFDLFRDGKRVSDEDAAHYAHALEQVEAAIMGHKGTDMSLYDLLRLQREREAHARGDRNPSPQTWANRLAQITLGALDAAGNAEQLSVLGVQQHGSNQPNWLVREGFGTLVATLGAGLPIALGAHVKQIDYSGKRVHVTTTRGSVSAKHCIITVSTGVLQSEAIRFVPALPAATLQAIDDLPMGHFNKVVLELDDHLQEQVHGGWLLDTRTTEDDALNFVCHPFGAKQVIALAGGRYAETLSTMERREAVAETTEKLRQCIGGLQGRVVRQGLNTTWARNPFTLGSYAYVKPGGENARGVLGTPINDRLFFVSR